MWVWLSLASALLLGVYDVAKKVALRRNGVYWVLLAATALSTLFVSPFFTAGTASQHLRLVFKAVLVTTSWVSGMIALDLLPITTVSTLKASRPMFVVLFSIVLFGERLSVLQWTGVVLVLAAIWLMSRASSREGLKFSSGKGFAALALSIFAGVASALWDKHIIGGMEPLFVQSWTNLYITAMLAVLVLVRSLRAGEKREKFTWDWTLLLIALFITGADACYFFSLKQPDAMLSVVSIIRRCSVLVTFVLGAIIFKEKNIRGKAVSLALMLAGIILLMFSSV